MDQYYFLNLFCVTDLQKDMGTTVPYRRSCQNKALYISTLLPIDLMQFLADSTEQKANPSGQVLPGPSEKKNDATHYLFQLTSFLGWFGRIGMVT
jgi:hypothetical protein